MGGGEGAGEGAPEGEAGEGEAAAGEVEALVEVLAWEWGRGCHRV